MPMSYSNLRCLGWICVVGDAFARSIGELMKSRIQISKIRVLVMLQSGPVLKFQGPRAKQKIGAFKASSIIFFYFLLSTSTNFLYDKKLKYIKTNSNMFIYYLKFLLTFLDVKSLIIVLLSTLSNNFFSIHKVANPLSRS